MYRMFRSMWFHFSNKHASCFILLQSYSNFCVSIIRDSLFLWKVHWIKRMSVVFYTTQQIENYSTLPVRVKSTITSNTVRTRYGALFVNIRLSRNKLRFSRSDAVSLKMNLLSQNNFHYVLCAFSNVL